MKEKWKAGNLIIHIVLILGSFAMLLPFIWMVITSLKSMMEATMIPPTFLPKILMWHNYVDVWNQLPFACFYINSGLMIVFRVISSVFFSAMAAYAFARIEFPGKNFSLC